MGQEGGEGEASHVGDVAPLLGLLQQVAHAGGQVIEGELTVGFPLDGGAKGLDPPDDGLYPIGQIFEDPLRDLQG